MWVLPGCHISFLTRLCILHLIGAVLFNTFVTSEKNILPLPSAFNPIYLFNAPLCHPKDQTWVSLMRHYRAKSLLPQHLECRDCRHPQAWCKTSTLVTQDSFIRNHESMWADSKSQKYLLFGEFSYIFLSAQTLPEGATKASRSYRMCLSSEHWWLKHITNVSHSLNEEET